MKKRILALILTTLVVTTFIAGCGGAKNSSAGAAAGKTFIFAQSSDPLGLDPAFVEDSQSAKVMSNIYEGLVKYAEKSTEIEPCLAESWDISQDGTEYTFHLKTGVKFHDGTEFNADAVVKSVSRQLSGNATADMPYATFTFDGVKSVEAIDKNTVKFTLAAPSTPFLSNLAMPLAAPIVSSKALEEHKGNLNEAPVGTGPFKFLSWDKGEKIILEKNTNYWGDKAKLDKVVFKVVKENSVRASELMTGSIDAMDAVDASDVEKLKEKKFNIFNESGMNVNYMAFNCSRAPFDNVKVRQAICYAINRDELVQYLYQGYSEIAKTALPKFIPGYKDSVTGYEYNPDKAKALLAEAGQENLNINMVIYSTGRQYNTVGPKLAEAIQNYLSKVGVTAKIDVYEWKEYKTKAKQGEGNITFSGWNGDNGDADNFLSLYSGKEIQSGLNAAKYSNPEVDKLLLQAKQLPNGAERNTIYGKIQDLVSQDAAWLPISHANQMAASGPKVKNFKIHPTSTIFFKDVDKE